MKVVVSGVISLVCLSPVFGRGTFAEPQVTGTGAEAVDGTGVGAGTLGQ